MATVTSIVCDVCKEKAAFSNASIPVCFTTEQTEGRSVEPHISIERMDLCKECMSRIIGEMPLMGAGAQGHNRYEWRK